MRTFLLAASVAFSVASAAAAQVSTDQETIVVTGQRAEEVARSFVGAASAPPARADQLARWDRKICAGVAGIGASQAQFLVDRISRRAFDVGLRPGAPGCQANVLVVFTREPNQFAAAMQNRQREFLGDVHAGLENTSTRGAAALDDFIATTRPVRWWHVSRRTTADGQRVRETPPIVSLDPAIPGTRPPVVRVRATHVASTTRQDFRNVLIVVDAGQVAGVSVNALSDYIAMATLAQLNPSADLTPFDTILNLFEPNTHHQEQMTAWDIAYLEGLYHVTRNPFHARTQEREIARSMAHDLAN